MISALRIKYIFLFLVSLTSLFAVPIQKITIDWQAGPSEKGPQLIYLQNENRADWEEKLEKEIFQDPEFVFATREKLSFIKNPTKNTSSLILADENGKMIVQVGFLSGGGKKYSEHLLSLVEMYVEISLALSSQNPDLKSLYEKAKTLGSLDLIDQVFERGVESDQGAYFLVEKYALLSSQDSEDLTDLRAEISKRDVKNKYGSRIALIDFQKLMQTEDDSKKAVIPLLAYIESNKDAKDLWKIEMVISQFFYNQELYDEALKHARKCYKQAPERVKKQIAEKIRYIRNALRQSRS